eukprot:4627446-Heterocapsa_arctica.AAC.1
MDVRPWNDSSHRLHLYVRDAACPSMCPRHHRVGHVCSRGPPRRRLLGGPDADRRPRAASACQ